MIYQTVSAKAVALYETWLVEQYPDVDLVTYYDYCDWADVLTSHVLDPLRKLYLKTLAESNNYSITPCKQLYQMLINYDEDGDIVNYMATELFIDLIDDHNNPYHSKIRVLDHLGTCLAIYV